MSDPAPPFAPYGPGPLVVIMGVSGSGQSTVGAALAARQACRFLDGDDLHPTGNVAKMVAGVPLDDADRLPWLQAVGDCLADARRGRHGLVVACSALRRTYREVILAVEPHSWFVHLDSPRDLVVGRLQARRNHFMPTALLDSQLATLEPLGADEPGLAVSVQDQPDGVVAEIVRRLGRVGVLSGHVDGDPGEQVQA